MAPSWSKRALIAFAFGGAVLLAPDEAAATEPLGIALSYEAPPGCPTREQLAAELRARVDASWLHGSDARRFDARIVRRDGGDYSGRLEIAQVGRPLKVRVIEAKTCGAVTTSIAVFLAIALDPSSEDAAAPPAATEPPIVEDRRPIEPEARPTVPPSPAASRPPPSPLPPPTTIWLWSGGFDATYLRMPAAAWGGRVHAELARAREHQALAAALRISWGFSRFSTFPERAGEASFLLETARVEGCARIDLSPLSADACGGLDVGTLTGHTPVLRESVVRTVQWIAAVALLRARWSILPWLSVSAEASITVPFERTTFALTAPSRLVYRAPAALFGSGAGLGVTARFP
ncbi:MAG: hypothetical protein JWO86_2759 [Myxococcaceae bacterium]|nr:hypothetical protein [Myxococcaceae bacterium]